MVVKVYVSLISCSQEIKKNQQRTIMILESKKIPYVAVDITDPSQEEAKDYVVTTAIPKPNSKIPITPQIFNEADYCGDFDQLDMANECDNLGEFLKMTEEEKKEIKIGITGILPEDRKKAQEAPVVPEPLLTNGINGATASREGSVSKDTAAAEGDEATTEKAADGTEPTEAAEPQAEATQEAAAENNNETPADTIAEAETEQEGTTEGVAESEEAQEPTAVAAAAAAAVADDDSSEGQTAAPAVDDEAAAAAQQEATETTAVTEDIVSSEPAEQNDVQQQD